MIVEISLYTDFITEEEYLAILAGSFGFFKARDGEKAPPSKTPTTRYPYSGGGGGGGGALAGGFGGTGGGGCGGGGGGGGGC